MSDLLERDRATEIKRPAPPEPPRPSRPAVRWFEWVIAVVLLVAAVGVSVALLQRDTTTDVVGLSPVLGARYQGQANVPEFVGLSGGDLPVTESSPLVLGARHIEGLASTPAFVGASGGDRPAVEASPLVLGARHLDGAVALPEYVGVSDAAVPEVEPWMPARYPLPKGKWMID